MRNYAGEVRTRVPSELHKDLAREAFERGRSINQLCLEAIMARNRPYNRDRDRLGDHILDLTSEVWETQGGG